MISHIKISGGPAPGTIRIEVDGVEQRGVCSVEFKAQAGEVGTATLTYLASTELEGDFEVEKVHICPECKGQLEQRITDTSTVDSERRKVQPVGGTV